MEKVVYLFGAGFSAPLGLPVMSNFIEKSKDMYFNERENYKHFNAIYDLIREIAYLKNYINSDLFNIEEILSILEMGHLVGDNQKELKRYNEFLKDVIKFYTPNISGNQEQININNWYKNIFGDSNSYVHNFYGFFIANLFQMKLGANFENDNSSSMDFYSDLGGNWKNVEYGIITLNYDLVLENFANYIDRKHKLLGENICWEFVKKEYDNVVHFNKIRLAKLHGCISNKIIPPTWNKSSSNSDSIKNAWKLAYNMLTEANEIRIIGYSLPVSDSYIKYLLSIALKNAAHLKKIDVITLDSDKSTQDRYTKLFSFPKFRYKNAKFEDFLHWTYGRNNSIELSTMTTNVNNLPLESSYKNSEIKLYSSILEKAHNSFMESELIMRPFG